MYRFTIEELERQFREYLPERITLVSSQGISRMTVQIAEDFMRRFKMEELQKDYGYQGTAFRAAANCVAVLAVMKRGGCTFAGKTWTVEDGGPLPFEDMDRAGGEVKCEVCGLEYRQHPPDLGELSNNDEPFLVVLCEGRKRAKL